MNEIRSSLFLRNYSASGWSASKREEGEGKAEWKEDSEAKGVQVKRNECQLQREGKGLKGEGKGVTTGRMQDIRGGEALE